MSILNDMIAGNVGGTGELADYHDQDFFYFSGAKERIEADLGITDPLETGKFDEFKKGFKTDMKSTLGGMYSTLGVLGSTKAEKAYQEYLSKQRISKNERPAKGLANQAAWLMGNGTSQLFKFMAFQAGGGQIGAGAGKLINAGRKVAGAMHSAGVASASISAGQVGGMFASIAGRQYGDDARFYMERGATVGEAKFLSLLQSLATTGIEQIAGPQRVVGKWLKQRSMNKMLKNLGRLDDMTKSQMDDVARAIAWPKPRNPLLTTILQTAEEVGEESAEYVQRQLLIQAAFGDNDFSWQELGRTTLEAIPASLPGGFVGGVASVSLNQKQFREDIAATPDEATMAAAFTTKDGDSAESQKAFEEALQGMSSATAQMDLEGADYFVDLMGRVAINLAAFDENSSPVDYLNTFEQVMAGKEVDNAKVAEFVDARDEQGLLEYLQNTIPEYREKVFSAQKTGQIDNLKLVNQNQFERNKEDIGGAYDTMEKMTERVEKSLASMDPDGNIDENTVIPPHIAASMDENTFNVLWTVRKMDVTTKGGRKLTMTMYEDGSIGFRKTSETKFDEGQDGELQQEQRREIELVEHHENGNQDSLTYIRNKVLEDRKRVQQQAPGTPMSVAEWIAQDVREDTVFIATEDGQVVEVTQKEMQDTFDAIDRILNGEVVVSPQQIQEAVEQAQNLDNLSQVMSELRQRLTIEQAQPQQVLGQVEERVLREELRQAMNDVKQRIIDRESAMAKKPPKQVRQTFESMAQRKVERRITIEQAKEIADALGGRVAIEPQTKQRLDESAINGEIQEATDALGPWESVDNASDQELVDRTSSLEEKRTPLETELEAAREQATLESMEVNEGMDIKLVAKAFNALINEGRIKRPEGTISKSQMIEMIDKKRLKRSKVTDETNAKISRLENTLGALDVRQNLIRQEQENRQALAQAEERGRRGYRRSIKVSASDRIYGTYLPSYNLAVYYEGATGEQVLHEWMHHLFSQGLMRQEHIDVLVRTYSNTGTMDVEAEEKAISAVSRFIRDGVIDRETSQEVIDAMENVRGLMQQSFHAEMSELNDEAIGVMSQWFGLPTDAEIDQSPVVSGILRATEMAQGVNNEEAREFDAIKTSRAQRFDTVEDVLNAELYNPTRVELAKDRFTSWDVRRSPNVELGVDMYSVTHPQTGQEFFRGTKKEVDEYVVDNPFEAIESSVDVGAPDVVIEDSAVGAKVQHNNADAVLTGRFRNDAGDWYAEVEYKGGENDGQMKWRPAETIRMKSPEIMASRSGAFQLDPNMKDTKENRKSLRNEIYRRGISNPKRDQALERLAEALGLPSKQDLDVKTLQAILATDGEQIGGKRKVLEDLIREKLSKTTNETSSEENSRVIAEAQRADALYDALDSELDANERARNIEEDINKRPYSGPQRANAVGGSGNLSTIKNKLNRSMQEVKNWRHNIVGGILTRLTDVRTFVDQLTDGRTDSPIYSDVYNTLQNMNTKLGNKRKQTSDWFVNRMKKAGLSGVNLDKVFNQLVVIDGKSFTVEELLGIHLMTRGNHNGIEAQKLYESNHTISIDQNGNKSPAQFLKVLRMADETVRKTKELRQFRDVLDDYYKHVAKEIAPVYNKLNQRKFRTVEHYFPMIRKGGMAIDEDWLANLLGITPSKTDAKFSTESGRFKSRVEKAAGGVIRTDVRNILTEYIDMADTYVAKAEDVDTLRKIWNRSKDAFIAKGLNNEHETMLTYIEREMYPNGRMNPMGAFEVVLKAVRSNVQWATLVGNSPSIVRQGISIFDGISHVPGASGLKAFSIYNKAQLHFITGASRSANNKTGNVLDGFEYFELMKKHNSQHTRAFFDPEVRELVGDKGIRGKKIRALGGKTISEIGLLPQHIHDAITRTAIWGIAYDYRLDQEKGKALVSDQEAEKIAARFAEEVVNISQPPASTSQRTLWQTGNEWEKMLSTFSGQLYIKFASFRSDIYRPLARAWADGATTDAKLKNAFDVFFRNAPVGSETTVGRKVFFQLVVPPVMMGLLFRGRPPEDMKEFMQDMFMYNISMIPIIGAPLGFLYMYDQAQAGPMYTQAYDAIARSAMKFEDLVTGDASLKEAGGTMLHATQYFGFPKELIRQFVKIPYFKNYYKEHGIDIETVIKAMFRWNESDDTLVDDVKDLFD